MLAARAGRGTGVAHAPARSPSAVNMAPSEAHLPLALFALTPTLEITSGRREGYVTGSVGAGTHAGAGTARDALGVRLRTGSRALALLSRYGSSGCAAIPCAAREALANVVARARISRASALEVLWISTLNLSAAAWTRILTTESGKKNGSLPAKAAVRSLVRLALWHSSARFSHSAVSPRAGRT